jgi:hypothetical protein
MKTLLVTLIVFLLPIGALAASPYVDAGSSVLVATSTVGNVYAAGGTVTVTTTISGDLVAVGGAHVIDASITSDLLLAGGSVKVTGPVGGDARLLGGKVTLADRVGGDLVVFAGAIEDTAGSARSSLVFAGEVNLTRGAKGPVTVYGNTVLLAGTFTSDVTVYTIGKLELAEGTVVKGALNYQAPQEAEIPASAVIEGGVRYTGASYLPTSEEARAIALASFGVFLFVKVLGALILAGLLAGLFPSFASAVVLRATRVDPRIFFLTLLLGFGVVVATPVLLILLSITFVGLGLALILGLAYFLLIALAFIYAAIVLGALIGRYVFRRSQLYLIDAVLGMLALFTLWSIPSLGSLLLVLALMYMVGALTHLMYRFAFPREHLNDF